jgi:phospholipase C
MASSAAPGEDFIICRRADSDAYGLWRVDLESPALLHPVPLARGAKLDRRHSIAPVGRYILEWGPAAMGDYEPSFPYRLMEFDPTSGDPLQVPELRKGLWSKAKFWSYRVDFGNPHGAKESYDAGENLLLLPLGSFVLNVIPTMGRGTFQLWNFDPDLNNSAPSRRLSDNPHPIRSDPLPSPYTPQGSFDFIDFDHELIAHGNYVLDRIPETGEYWLWSFDPQAVMPLAQPAVQHGRWKHIGKRHQLVPLGEFLLDWVPADGRYRLWRFDPASADPLTGPVREGRLPRGVRGKTSLTAVHAPRTVNPARAGMPGTMDFMRDRIKHVVYLMLENRSFDHICGWLYDKSDTGINFVGRDSPFDGASTRMYNVDPGDGRGRKAVRVPLSKYHGGRLSEQWDLDFLPNDPFHDKSDVIRQLFYGQQDGYDAQAKPGMGGFVWNNGVHDVMMTYSPEQLPILNGLARNFAVSDAWFSSMPSATDPNRAFAFTGSALGELNNFQNGNTYLYWPTKPHRASIWKTLWTNGFSDWKLYHSVEWMNFVHTYHLYLQGTIPSVDAAVARDPTSFLDTVDQFKLDAKAGKLPAFCFLEPIWIAMAGTSSYHPGASPVVGERALNGIYDAIRESPLWKDTLFIITFDEHGGIYDHAPPPRAANPWPNDANDGFRYDLMGVRVPTILVSPWIREKTVFRSPTPVAYDSTSILATLLQWAGVPKARWCMGERVQQAPTFEGVFQNSEPRLKTPKLTPPYDKSYPRSGEANPSARISDLHRLMAPRVVAALGKGKLSDDEILRLAQEVTTGLKDAESLHRRLAQLARRLA